VLVLGGAAHAPRLAGCDPGPYPIPKKVHVEHGGDRHALILDRSA